MELFATMREEAGLDTISGLAFSNSYFYRYPDKVAIELAV
jgi:hypothetical protein